MPWSPSTSLNLVVATGATEATGNGLGHARLLSGTPRDGDGQLPAEHLLGESHLRFHGRLVFAGLDLVRRLAGRLAHAVDRGVTREIFDFAQMEPHALSDIRMLLLSCNDEEVDHLETVASKVLEAIELLGTPESEFAELI